jgi:hypothetical protein
MSRSACFVLLLWYITSPVSTPGQYDNAAREGEVLAEPSTLHCLAVRWPIFGDANENAIVTVRYRREGDSEWLQGYPLFRTHADPYPENETPTHRIPGGHLFAGSIVGLLPGTAYEVMLILEDPDGTDATRRLVLRTLEEPAEPTGMRIRHVVPESSPAAAGGDGSEQRPFRGLTAAEQAAEPGDLFLIHGGTYRPGTWDITRHGSAEMPIIWRGAGDGEAILDGGGGNGRLVSANEIHHVWFEDLTFQNREYLIVAHDGGNMVVRRCIFHVQMVGITAINGGYEKSRGFFISDCVFEGPTTWPRTRGIEAIQAINITGAGHVVCYNRIRGMGDGIHGSQYGNLSASDYHNNEISECTDDGIETDYSETNVRVYRNRITNSFSGISAQPVQGGPVYIFRNMMYNLLYSPFKLHNHTAGVIILHNSSVLRGIPFHIDPAGETVSDVVTRNNLFMGTEEPALRSTGWMIRCDFDSDGYGGWRGDFADWNGKTYRSMNSARSSKLLYSEHGAVEVNAGRCFESGLRAPRDPRRQSDPETNDLRLSARSDAIDRGVELPNFNNGFVGKAPDLGCCERGEDLPHYGPRPSVRR